MNKTQYNPFDLGTPTPDGYKVTNANTVNREEYLREFEKEFWIIVTNEFPHVHADKFTEFLNLFERYFELLTNRKK